MASITSRSYAHTDDDEHYIDVIHYKNANPHHWNLRVIFNQNTCTCKYIAKNCAFFLSSSERLARRSLSVSPWFTHKSTPFHSPQVHDVSVLNKRHFDHCRFYQWYTPTALMKETILTVAMCACPVGKVYSI